MNYLAATSGPLFLTFFPFLFLLAPGTKTFSRTSAWLRRSQKFFPCSTAQTQPSGCDSWHHGHASTRHLNRGRRPALQLLVESRLREVSGTRIPTNWSQRGRSPWWLLANKLLAQPTTLLGFFGASPAFVALHQWEVTACSAVDALVSPEHVTLLSHEWLSCPPLGTITSAHASGPHRGNTREPCERVCLGGSRSALPPLACPPTILTLRATRTGTRFSLVHGG